MKNIKKPIGRTIKKSYSISDYQNSFNNYGNAFRSRSVPTENDLIQSYKNTVYSCVRINARAVSSLGLRFFVKKDPGQNNPRFWKSERVTKSLDSRLKSDPSLYPKIRQSSEIFELYDHPIIDLFNNVNKYMVRSNLIEYTVSSQDIVGNAFWYIERSSKTNIPVAIWPLEPHKVVVEIDQDNPSEIIGYKYAGSKSYTFDEVIHFFYISAQTPYSYGLSPLRAAYENMSVNDKLLAYEESVLDNRARPDILISPKEPISPEESTRTEQKFASKYGRGGSGGVLVGESNFEYKALNFPPSDLAALQIRNISKEEIANAFGVPMSMLKSMEVTRANAEASEYFHAKNTVRPICRAIQERINKELCPMYDERIFCSFENPVPEDIERETDYWKMRLHNGTATINQFRESQGELPVENGDKILVPTTHMPLDIMVTANPNDLANRQIYGKKDKTNNEKEE